MRAAAAWDGDRSRAVRYPHPAAVDARNRAPRAAAADAMVAGLPGGSNRGLRAARTRVAPCSSVVAGALAARLRSTDRSASASLLSRRLQCRCGGTRDARSRGRRARGESRRSNAGACRARGLAVASRRNERSAMSATRSRRRSGIAVGDGRETRLRSAAPRPRSRHARRRAASRSARRESDLRNAAAAGTAGPAR
jgi:hypothetical protein